MTAGGVAVLVGAVFVFANQRAIGEALGELAIVVYGLAAAAAVIVPTGLVFLVRYNRRRAVMFTARRAELEAAEDARVARRREVAHQRALEVARASAPVIENHVHLGALADLVRGYTPATVIHDRELNR